jgi:hypothetical protein
MRGIFDAIAAGTLVGTSVYGVFVICEALLR